MNAVGIDVSKGRSTVAVVQPFGVAGADKIVVLSDGVVKESGKPSELLQKNGIFAQMMKTQNAGQNWSIT